MLLLVELRQVAGLYRDRRGNPASATMAACERRLARRLHSLICRSAVPGGGGVGQHWELESMGVRLTQKCIRRQLCHFHLPVRFFIPERSSPEWPHPASL